MVTPPGEQARTDSFSRASSNTKLVRSTVKITRKVKTPREGEFSSFLFEGYATKPAFLRVM